MRLENWSVIQILGKYQAPELSKYHLVGDVYGHNMIIDGQRIETTRIISSEGRFVTTRTGSVYELGKASDDYLEFLKSQDKVLDEQQPVKVFKHQ